MSIRDRIEAMRPRFLLLILAAVSFGLWTVVSGAGNLRSRPVFYLACHGLLVGAMFAAWFHLRRRADGFRIVLIAALAFRIVAGLGAPTLSDDVYRYVWDGNVQLHGFHPYRFAPDDPELGALRGQDWSRINHAELRTIYPPLAQMTFATLAALGAGPVGFKLAMGVLDFAVVLALGQLLSGLGLPRHRLVLYAWNPLSIVESAGSGHVEPLGVLLVVLAVVWIIGRRRGLSTTALAAAIQVKLLPVVLVPTIARWFGARGIVLVLAVTLLLAAPYALTGPPIGAGLFAYAEHWERNSSVFGIVHGLFERLDTGTALRPAVAWLEQLAGGSSRVSWDFLYRITWPAGMARVTVAGLAVAWLAWLAMRGPRDPVRLALLSLGGTLLLSPTLHPWYLLWVLPFAVALLSRGWILLALLAPLSYLATDGDVSWKIRVVEYLPPLAVALWTLARGNRR